MNIWEAAEWPAKQFGVSLEGPRVVPNWAKTSKLAVLNLVHLFCSKNDYRSSRKAQQNEYFKPLPKKSSIPITITNGSILHKNQYQSITNIWFGTIALYHLHFRQCLLDWDPYLDFHTHLDDIMLGRVVLVAVGEHQSYVGSKFRSTMVFTILEPFLWKKVEMAIPQQPQNMTVHQRFPRISLFK